MAVHTSYCRLCPASCGVQVEIEDNRILGILGDNRNALSQGYTCPKGRRGGDLIQGPDRLTGPLRRTAAGDHVPVGVDEATAEIAARLQNIIAEHGPDSVAMYMGTQQNFAALTPLFAKSWFRTLGSHKLFSTMTIDQSAKWVVPARMGQYTGGRQSFQDADVWLLAGTNPLVSMNGGDGDGALTSNPSATLRAARRRGAKLIVIDPRRTETAYHADLHLQPRPGHDALLFAGLLNIILSEKLYDAGFCAGYVDGLAELADAVKGAVPELVERSTGVPAEDLRRAARLFAGAARGMATTGTGVCMGPHSNIAEHLAVCLNVVCGRYLREGEPAAGPAVLTRDVAPRAEVIPPDRSWETGFRSRIGGAGMLRGELPTGILADEILEPGPDRIRALIVSGGNPATALPGGAKAKRALEALELLVTIDTRLSETSQLADFVIAPTMLYERADHTLLNEAFFAKPFAQFTPALISPPAGVIEDWQFFYRLAAAMGSRIRFAGRDLDMTKEPGSQELLRMVTERGRVPLDEVMRAPHGLVAEARTTRVGPASPAAAGNRLQLCPDDVRAELEAALGAGPADPGFEFRLVVRRMRELMNSLGRSVPGLPRQDYNPAQLNPRDLARLGIPTGSRIVLRSAHGQVSAIAHADPTVAPGSVSMTHAWGSLEPGSAPPEHGGSNVNGLTTGDSGLQTINHMPTMTAIPVTIDYSGPGR